jgi:hypothetical protein
MALVAAGSTILAVLLGGCGSSTTPTIVSHVSVRTRAGVRFNAELRIHGPQACLFQTYAVIAPHVMPFSQTTRSCARSNAPARAMLIQVAKPVTTFILDRAAHGCPEVTITTGGRQSVVVHPSCSATPPTLRLTPLPRAATLTMVGIPGITRLVLRDYRCPFICSRPISP